MRMLRTELGIDELALYYDNIEDHFHIDKDGLLIDKTLTEKAAAGIVSFEASLLMSSTEFTQMQGESDALKAIALTQQLKLFKTSDDYTQGLDLLLRDFLNRLEAEYPPGRELNITKAHTDWLADGSPQDDERKAKYDKMQGYIEQLRQAYAGTKVQLKELRTDLQKKEQAKKAALKG
jgi:hypothetical protein